MGRGHWGWGHMMRPREARSSGSVECGQLDACTWKYEKRGRECYRATCKLCLPMAKDRRGAGNNRNHWICLWRGTVGEPYCFHDSYHVVCEKSSSTKSESGTG